MIGMHICYPTGNYHWNNLTARYLAGGPSTIIHKSANSKGARFDGPTFIGTTGSERYVVNMNMSEDATIFIYPNGTIHRDQLGEETEEI